MPRAFTPITKSAIASTYSAKLAPPSVTRWSYSGSWNGKKSDCHALGRDVRARVLRGELQRIRQVRDDLAGAPVPETLHQLERPLVTEARIRRESKGGDTQPLTEA